MSLTKKMLEHLQKAPPDQAADIRVSDETLSVNLKLADWGRLGCLLTRLEMEHAREGQLKIDPVRISKKITYLEERLEIIESEGRRGRTILRSAPPRTDGGMIGFYEIVLDQATRLSLARYRYEHNTEGRTSIPASFSRETLERLLGDWITLGHEA
jgi:hypothetical protein